MLKIIFTDNWKLTCKASIEQKLEEKVIVKTITCGYTGHVFNEKHKHCKGQRYFSTFSPPK